ncbi:phosphotransferase family protein [Nocardia jiangxiensis]|uniref:phosphotransferase family protein n=1 Tax=Nocardia jiangxiensis TaxID=282685 RepID=UPI0002F97475|nr:phosphotransferase family protein [Nocardia jiangxiensis]
MKGNRTAMEPGPVFSKGRDLDAAVTALQPWLADRMGVASVVLDRPTYPRGAGFSNETMLVTAHVAGHIEELVVRIAPAPENQVFYEPKFHLQHDILVALDKASEVLVPRALWFETDTSVLGQPFYVMRRMHGKVPVSMPAYNSSGWLAEATPAQRRTAWESAMAQLAAIHRIPLSTVSFIDRPEHGPAGDTQHLGYWRSYTQWALGEDIPDVVLALFDWLDEHRPAASRPGLSWGDARIGNIMFDNDFRVVGVMDWEQSSLAGQVADLAWWLLFDDSLSIGQGVPRLDGLGTRTETIDLWQESTGLSTENLHWHEVFAGLKAGLFSLRSHRSMHPPTNSGTRRFSYLNRACELTGVITPEDAR